jgi:tetratricopeptide (TPR) repeat protein
MRCICLFVLSLGLVRPAPVAAHGDLHDQIAAVTHQIHQDPTNATLFLKRGELYRVHREWEAALSDYAEVVRLDPNSRAIDFFLGRMLLESDRPVPACECLNRFLAKQPDHVEALIARARVLAKLGKASAAAKDFTRALAHLAEPKPEYYLERADAVMSGSGRRVETALRGLDEGMKRLGPVLTLQLRAIDLELAGKHYKASLDRLEQILEQSQRKETWLARKGEILQRAGCEKEAGEAFTAALKAVESLPPQHRRTRAMTLLENRLRAVLERPALALADKASSKH